ncbi:MAG: hypothetical protein ABSF60_04755, partial [Verrucomicrobiota bacterium]
CDHVLSAGITPDKHGMKRKQRQEMKQGQPFSALVALGVCALSPAPQTIYGHIGTGNFICLCAKQEKHG